MAVQRYALVKDNLIENIFLLEESKLPSWPVANGFSVMLLSKAQSQGLQQKEDELSAEAAMTKARHEMAEILDALSPALQVEILTLRTSIEKALDLGKVDIAYLAVTSADVIPELEPTKLAIIQKFNELGVQ